MLVFRSPRWLALRYLSFRPVFALSVSPTLGGAHTDFVNLAMQTDFHRQVSRSYEGQFRLFVFKLGLQALQRWPGKDRWLRRR